MMEGQSADERLVIMLEARVQEFERRMIASERRGTRTYNSLRTNSRGATQQMERDAITAAARVNGALATVGSAVGDFAKGFGLGFLALGVNELAGAARNAVGAIADMGAEAKRAGLAVDEFQRWRFVAEQNRIGIDSLTDGFKELSLRADEFIITGAGAGKEAFERLGFSAEELAAALKDPSALFLDIIGRLEQFDRAAQIRIADEIFGGTGGEKFVQLLDQGAVKIGETKAQADALGVVIDQDLVAKATALDAQFRQWGATIAATFQAGTVEVAQFFGAVDDSIFDALVDTRALASAMADGAAALAGIGSTAAAGALASVASEMANLAAQFDAGAITAGQYQAALGEVLARADSAIAGMDDLDAVRLAGVRAEVRELLAALDDLPPAAQEAAAAVAQVAAPVVGDYRTGYGNAYTPAPPSAPATSGAPARGVGGGGGGNARLDALLRDLQTEKEAVTAWHNESLALLQSATDSQLAVYGGRHAAIERLEAEHAARMGALQQAGGAGTLANAQSLFGALATITAGGNDRMLRAQQKFAAAEALINTYRAQAQVLANPSLNFWAKLPAMAAIGAAGMGLVRALRGSGSAGAVPSAMPNAGGVSGASERASPVGASAGSNAAPPLRFMVQGLDPAHLYTGQALIDLVSNIQAELGNRGLVMEFNR